MSIELDPHRDWVEITSWGDPEPRYILGRCNHIDLVPVEDVSGELVAWLCLTCDQQWIVGRHPDQLNHPDTYIAEWPD